VVVRRQSGSHRRSISLSVALRRPIICARIRSGRTSQPLPQGGGGPHVRTRENGNECQKKKLYKRVIRYFYATILYDYCTTATASKIVR